MPITLPVGVVDRAFSRGKEPPLSTLEQGQQRSAAQSTDGGAQSRLVESERHVPVTALLTQRQYGWTRELAGAMTGLECTPSHVIRLALDELRARHWSSKTLEAALRRQVWREREARRGQTRGALPTPGGAQEETYRRVRVQLIEQEYVWIQAVISAMVGLQCSASHVIRLALDDLRERHQSARALEAALRAQIWREVRGTSGDGPRVPRQRRAQPAPSHATRQPQDHPSMESSLVRVLLVDDHAIVRAGLAASLENTSDLVVAGELPDGESAVAFVERESPDVVLMDLTMPGMGGIAAIRAIAERHRDVKVIAFPTFADREQVLAAVEAGAVSFVFKDAAQEEVVASIRAAARGESPVALRAALALLSDRAGRMTSTALTNREREVLTLVGRGFANKQIARSLGISVKTVKAHLGNAFQRIGVSDRTQAAVWAERSGLLEGS